MQPLSRPHGTPTGSGGIAALADGKAGHIARADGLGDVNRAGGNGRAEIISTDHDEIPLFLFDVMRIARTEYISA